MSLGRVLNDELDTLDGAGAVSVEHEGTRAEATVVDVGRLGVSIERVKVSRSDPRDLVSEAERLPDGVRSLPDRIVPVEVDPALGGAILRTSPDEIRDRKFFEVGVTPTEVEVRRYRVNDGEREPEGFTLAREQLERLVDELAG